MVALATGHRKSPAHHRESEAGLSLRPHLARVDQPAEVGSTRPLNEAAGGWLHSAGPAAGRSILWREAPKQKPRQRSGAKVGPSFVINRTCRSLRRTASPPPQRRAAPLVAHSAAGGGRRTKKPRRSGARFHRRGLPLATTANHEYNSTVGCTAQPPGPSPAYALKSPGGLRQLEKLTSGPPQSLQSLSYGHQQRASGGGRGRQTKAPPPGERG